MLKEHCYSYGIIKARKSTLEIKIYQLDMDALLFESAFLL